MSSSLTGPFLGIVLLVIASAAVAEEAVPASGRTASLSWVRLDGAEDCVTPRELASAVEARLGRQALQSVAQADLSIEGRVERVDQPTAGWRATLVVSDADGERLDERSITNAEGVDECSSINDELLLAIVAMIETPTPDLPPEGETPTEPPPEAVAPGPETGQPDEGEATLPESAESPEPVESQPVEAVEVESSETADAGGGGEGGEGDSEVEQVEAGEGGEGGGGEEQAEEQERLEYSISASFVGGMGFLPGAPLGASASFVIDLVGFWPIEIEVGGIFYSRAEAVGGGAARFYQAHGGALICAPLTIRNIPFRGCFGAIVGGVHFAGQDFSVNHEDWRLIVHAAGRIWAMWSPREGPLMFRIGVTVLVPIMQDRYTYIDQTGATQVLVEPEVVGAAFDLGIGARF